MGLRKLLLVHILVILVSRSNAELYSIEIPKNITLTMKIIKLELESTKNELLTTIDDLEQRSGISDITNHLIEFQSNVKQILSGNQLIQVETYLSNASTSINNWYKNILTISEGLKVAINELTIVDFDSFPSDDIIEIKKNLQSRLEDTVVKLYTYNTIIHEKLIQSSMTELTQFIKMMNSIQQMFDHNDTQVSVSILPNRIIALSSFLHIRRYFNERMNLISPQFFKLTSIMTESYLGFITPMVSLLIGILNQCPDCLNSNTTVNLNS
ncbi:unnamed protein product [Adineta ricciae]|uniref:Uncharacterized protein n=2 Tax=Adineta ricciae TaxID=249248 RepID=A0A816EGR6_ADIRI|nr:unnamed protein product [Adineta ricciae]